MKRYVPAALALMLLVGGCQSDNGQSQSQSTPTASSPASNPPVPASSTAMGPQPLASAGDGTEVTTSDGLKYVDLKVGTGPSPQPGQTVVVNYVGTLTDGTKFDASADHGGTFSFTIGEGQVIKEAD